MYYWISMDIRERGRISNWWTGLDSNQRTENRADLQSAAFNHSATCPHLRRGIMCWHEGRSRRRSSPMAKGPLPVNASSGKGGQNVLFLINR